MLRWNGFFQSRTKFACKSTKPILLGSSQLPWANVIPSKPDVVYGPIERAAQLDELLDRRRDHLDLRHVFAGPRHVVDRLGRTVEIPLARLVEQFQRVLDIDDGRV